MKNLLLSCCLITFLFSSCLKDRTFEIATNTVDSTPQNHYTIGTRALIHYWNFNNSAYLTPNISKVSGATINFDYSTVDASIRHDSIDTYTRIDTLSANAQNNDLPGNALRVRCPVTSVIISAPTTHYKNIILAYAVAKSSSGPATNNVSYSIDGINFINTSITPKTYSVNTDPTYDVQSFDFTNISGANNNPNFKFKIELVGANTAITGNNRFDNITVFGDCLTVVTSGATNISLDSAVVGGNITNDGGSTITERGVVYGTSANPSLTSNTKVTIGSGMGQFTKSITGLTQNTTYHYRAYAINSTDTAYGEDVYFTTSLLKLLHYWNFNSPFSLTPNVSLINGAALAFDYSTVSITPGYNDSVIRTDILVANAQNNDLPGNALRVRCPVTSMIINAPTTNYKNISLSFAAAKSSSGPGTDSIYYSIDGGTSWTTNGISASVFSVYTDPDYRVNSFDFSSINTINNNPNFKIKIVLVGANTAITGNDRYDNITIKGVHQ